MRANRWPLHGQQWAGPVQILLDMPVKGGGSRKRSHKARGITEQGADRQFFDRVLNGESRPMSVAEYYHTEYGCRWVPVLPSLSVWTDVVAGHMQICDCGALMHGLGNQS